ncbi:MAG: hypothetical protein IID46_01670 [Planctomycetes bacterium]|nr:hypothetical protein [Planctomycetota bacterium]
MATAEQWLAKMANLRVDRASGDPAPHKPLLLLAILEYAERGDLPAETLPLSPELAFQFYTYWAIVAHRRASSQAETCCSIAVSSFTHGWLLVGSRRRRESVKT